MDSELLRLAERVEAAMADEQKTLIGDAWDLIAPTLPKTAVGALASRFARMLDAEAYESAALMLVPEGWDWALYGSCDGFRPCAQLETDRMRREAAVSFEPISSEAATPALALTAAALRARAHEAKEER